MQVVLTNLSNSLFEESRELLNKSANKAGIKTIVSFDFSHIVSTPFYETNSSILTQPTGLGYWLWKPYIILEVFNTLLDGDIVIYSDCGIKIIKDLKPLIDLCNDETNILLFANSNYTNKNWTKRDCFILMNCDDEKYWNGIHCDAAFCLFKKSGETTRFLKEWLHYGSNINIISDQLNVCGEANFPDFIQHRRDQSILSLLAIKYNLSTYRMPTEFGNHYKLPEYRVQHEVNCINQGDQTQLDYYSIFPSKNSYYHQLLEHHRKKNSHINQSDVMNQNDVVSKFKNAYNFYSKGLWFKSLIKSCLKKLTNIL